MLFHFDVTTVRLLLTLTTHMVLQGQVFMLSNKRNRQFPNLVYRKTLV